MPPEIEPPEPLTLSAFIARVRQDEALRMRFARNPQALLRELGIDPEPYALPDRLSDAQLDRLLVDWSRGPGAAAPVLEPKAPPGPAPVYGPPPGFRKRR